MQAAAEFIAAGGNRHPSAADWDPAGSGILAFGADCNVALWKPLVDDFAGVYALLKGHASPVNAVKFFPSPVTTATILLSAGSDGSIQAWRSTNGRDFTQAASGRASKKAVNDIAVLPNVDIFVTAPAASMLHVWRLNVQEPSMDVSLSLLQSIAMPSKFYPLTICMSMLPSSESIVLAAAGTSSAVQLFTSDRSDQPFSHSATLTGHEGWIRSLDFALDTASDCSMLTLASSSQDKYIRLWSIREAANTTSSDELSGSGAFESSTFLANKSHRFLVGSTKFAVAFEALLLGHEDWVFTVRWSSFHGKQCLLSASADNSLALWSMDVASGVWVCAVRLGELSSQKGATTATGSTGGFWLALWSPDHSAVACLGRTGSWRMWTYDSVSDLWSQEIGVTGHTKAVRDVTWSPDGSYLLSTSSDQTTRLFAPWYRNEHSLTWHEFSRPQIHGYDLNCVATISATQIVSGADEKLLRVFEQPKAVASHLAKLCRAQTSVELLPDAASIPVLGLSNKAIDAKTFNTEENDTESSIEDLAAAQTASMSQAAASRDKPPLEDHLARHLLWPEAEKLYGHGYEISAVAASHSGSLLATACRASSVEHAVVRIFETKSWREIKPPLSGHALTVTSLRFSPDDKYLLTVGRDRQCIVFGRQSTADDEVFRLVRSIPKAHVRMILACSWGPLGDAVSYNYFATAGRDKHIHIWSLESIVHSDATPLRIEKHEPVTAVDFLGYRVRGNMIMASALESGLVEITGLSDTLETVFAVALPLTICPAGPVTCISWQPGSRHPDELDESTCRLAIGSQDSSLRIVDVRLLDD